jgi:hypothetical protein
MLLTTLLAIVCATAPIPKDMQVEPKYQVVLAVCLSTTKSEGTRVESSVRVLKNLTDESSNRLVGKRLILSYVDSTAPALRAVTPETLYIQPLDPGDEVYVVVEYSKGGQFSILSNCIEASEHVLPKLSFLTHKPSASGGPDIKQGSPTTPNSDTTRKLAKVVAEGLRVRSREQKDVLIRNHRSAKDREIAQYCDWLNSKIDTIPEVP